MEYYVVIKEFGTDKEIKRMGPMDEVTVMMNGDSGNVFLTNSDFQVAMMNGDKLKSFYSCPICGHEGFLEEMEHGGDEGECHEYLMQIKEA